MRDPNASGTTDKPTKRAATPARADSRLSRNVKVLGWASFFNDVASEMVYPLLPQFILTVLGGSRTQLGLIEGAADSMAALVKWWSGRVSDRLGRRRGLVVAGYSITALSRPFIGAANHVWQMVTLRSLDRLGKGVRTSPRDALIVDSTVPGFRGRAFGFQRSMDHLGAAIGPLIAAAYLWFRPDDLRTLFWLTAIPGSILVWLVWWGVKDSQRQAGTPETSGAEGEAPQGEETDLLKENAPTDRTEADALAAGSLRGDGRGDVVEPVVSGRMKLFLIAMLIFTLGNSSDAFLLVRCTEMGVPLAVLPLLWFGFHVLKSGLSLVSGRWTDRVGPKIPLLTGWTIYALVYLGFAWVTTAWQAALVFLVYASFNALAEPAEKTWVGQLSSVSRRGTGFGWYNLAIGITAFPASLVFGWLYQHRGATVAFGWSVALAVAATIIVALVPQLPLRDSRDSSFERLDQAS